MQDIVCGDCKEILAGLDDNSIDLIVTDPPYGIDYVSAGGPRATDPNIKQRTQIVGDTFVDPQWFTSMYRVLKPNSAIYVFCCFRTYAIFEKAIKEAGFDLKTTLVWDKGNCGMGDLKGDYGNQTELIIYATKGRHILNGGRDRNILHYQRPADAYRLHPMQKPVDLIEYLISKSSQESDLVLDPFAGVCTVGKAAKALGRNYLMIEINEKWCGIGKQGINAVQEKLL